MFTILYASLTTTSWKPVKLLLTVHEELKKTKDCPYAFLLLLKVVLHEKPIEWG